MHISPKQLNFVKITLTHHGDLHPSKGALWHPIQTWHQNTKRHLEQCLGLGVSFSFHLSHFHQVHYKLRMSKLPRSVEEELQHFLKFLCPNAILLRQGSKGLCSSYGITLGQGEDRVKFEYDFQRLPSKPQIPATKVQ
jgi:hypothetical protein